MSKYTLHIYNIKYTRYNIFLKLINISKYKKEDVYDHRTVSGNQFERKQTFR